MPEAGGAGAAGSAKRSLSAERRDGVLIVRVRAKTVHAVEAEQLVATVFDPAAVPTRHVLLDLTGVHQLASAAVSALWRVNEQRTLRIIGMEPAVEKTLTAMGILRHLQRATTEAEALAAFGVAPAAK